MNNAPEILVIFLSVTLAVFLVLGIILLILCIRIASHIRRITQRAESFSNKAESVAEFLSKSTLSLLVGKLIAVAAEIFGGSVSKGKRKRGFKGRGKKES